MVQRAFLLLLAIVLTANVLADLQCGNLSIATTSSGLNCTACNQWAGGTVSKSGGDSGWLCVYACSTHSFDICEPSIVLWVGTEWNNNCFEVDSDVSTVNWTFQSKRSDWDDNRGSYAEIYIYVPCLNCTSKHVIVDWDSICPYCTDCQ